MKYLSNVCFLALATHTNRAGGASAASKDDYLKPPERLFEGLTLLSFGSISQKK